MAAQAKRLGAAIVDRERELDRQFADNRLTDIELRRRLDELAALQGELRYSHLHAHLSTRATLPSEQITRYGQLRGYAGNSSAVARSHSH